MHKDYTYSAFISYSHKDQKYAQKLHKKLENYRLPSALQHQIENKSKHPVAPVFRDATDLDAGKLKKNLHLGLENSKFLIVICSPNSACNNAQGKNYVNAEVEHFIALGKEDYIIPLIIDGIPGDPEKECFCSAIKMLELVGIDATKFPEARVINDVVAKILGLRPDELWQREKRRLFRKKVYAATGILLTVFSAIAAGLYYWDYNRDHIEYYAGYVKKWSIPCGIDPLKKEDLKFRYRYLRFLYRGRTGLFGKRILREISLRNSSGEIAEEKMNDVYQDFLTAHQSRLVLSYNENGMLSHCEFFNKEGKKTFIESYGGTDLRYIDLKRVKDKKEYWDAFAESENTNKSIICRFDVVRDQFGRIQKCFFRSGESMKSIKGPDGDYGYSVEYDKNSMIITKKSLDFNGKPMCSKKGYITHYEYDKSNRLKRIRYTDVNGTLMNSDTGYASAVLNYDQYGNCTSICYFDAGGNKARYKNRFAAAAFTYKNGNIIEIRHSDKNNTPCTVQNNKIPASIKLQHDKWGNLTEIAYFDSTNTLVNYKSCAKKRMKYIHKAGRSFVISEEKTGPDGKLVPSREEPVKYEYEYDKNGNKTVERRYGSDNKLFRKKGAIAVVQNEFNDKNRSIYEAYYDADLRRTADKHGLSFSKVIYEPQKITIQYYGPDEQSVIPKNEGCAKYVKYFDEFNRLIRGECYDQNNLKMNSLTANWHAVVVEYAPDNRISRLRFYDKNGKKCLARLNKDHLFSELRLKYENDNIVEQAYYGVDGKYITQRQGYAVIRRVYNNNKLIEETLFDKNLALCNPINGTNAKTAYEYYANGQRKSITYYSNDGRYNHVQYDTNGYKIQESFHAPNGELCMGPDNIAMIKYKNNKQGQEIERAFFSTYGTRIMAYPFNIAGIRSSYDRKGNKISESYFDLQEKICRSVSQVARIRYQYDSAGHKIAEYYYNELDMPTENIQQVASIRYKYNDNGKILSAKCFGIDGKPKNNFSGIHEVAFKYNARNCQTEKLFRNTAGKLVLTPEKIAGFRFEYDENDQIIKEEYVGLNGKLTKGPQGHAVELTEYDLMGNKTRISFYDENLKKCNNNVGFSVSRVKYDNLGRMIETRFWDKNGTPAHFVHENNKTEVLFISYDRFANKKYLYKLASTGNDSKDIKYYCSYISDQGLLLESRWLNKEKKPVDHPWGFAVTKYKYDLSGNLTEKRTFNAAGNPCVDKRTGISTTKIENTIHNDGRKTVKIYYLNPNGFYVETAEKVAWMQIKYDNNNNLIYYEIRDKNGEYPLSNNVKCHFAYDLQRRPIRMQQYSCVMQNGKKVLQKNGDTFFMINDQKGVVTCWSNGKLVRTVSIAQYKQVHQGFLRYMDSIANIYKQIKKKNWYEK